MNNLRRRTNSDQEFRSVLADNLNFQTNKIQYLETDMACRDRTVEFISVVKNKEGRLKEKYVPVRGKRHVKSLENWSSFMQTAHQIGRDIASTYGKLEKLTVLAKKKSLFADSPIEIEELTYVIKQDITSLNKQIAQLEELKAKNNSQHGKHMLHHSNSIVVSLQSKLASMSNDFRNVLEVRTENLKHEKSRRDKFSGLKNGTIYATGSALPSAISGENRSVLLSDESNSANECSVNIDNNINNQYQKQLQLIDEQDSYIQSRADVMQNIEVTIVELGTIFQQLSTMVKQQEEIVQRIDANVEESNLNIEAAHSQILKYFQGVSSNRWLMVKVFSILILFFIIFVVFVA